MEDRDKVIDYTKPIRLPDDSSKFRKNFTQGYFYREIGRYKNVIPSEFQWAAEDKLINKNTFEELKCQFPDSTRSTFLMVFSPDGKKVASTHGNHNVYVTDLTTGKNIQTLTGHPRTPWCIAFHPSSNQILASGCLGGQVRVWDLHGRSEVWTAESQTVIASLAFHPVDRMLVIATYNELHFWDWSQPEPFAKCSTKTEREKVRYVSFDPLGNKLITGIANPANVPSQWDRINVVNNQSLSTTNATTTTTTTSTAPTSTTTVSSNFSSTPTTLSSTQAPTDQGRSITFCYRHLMNQYNQLVNRYFDLSRSRITPTIDRGTDPMDLLDLRNTASTSESNTVNPSPSTSNSQSNTSSPLRFKITRSASRTYRPLSSRERFRIHSSIFSRLNNRTSSNSFTFTTSPSVSSSPTPTFTAPPSLGSPSTSSPSTSRLRRCAFSLSPTARSWCLTFTPESSSNLFFTRSSSHTTTSSSGAITNPTYTSYSDRGIFSTRETNSNNSEGSHFSVVLPSSYRVVYDDIDDHPLTIHRTTQQDGSETSNNRSTEIGANTVNNESLGRIRASRNSTGSSRDALLSGISERDTTLRSQRNEASTVPRSSFREELASNNDLPRGSTSLSRFQWTPVDLRNTNHERRFRENSHFDRLTSRNQNQSTSSQSLMHPRPVPRFQMRSRLLQDQQSQLQLITNRETHGLNLQNNQSLRRQLSFRPGGQFVLSRHSNSPFQPRVSEQSNTTPPSSSPKVHSSGNNTNIRPEIPSLRSSFATSLASGMNASLSSPERNSYSSNSVASNLSFTGEGNSSRQLREQIKTRLFDRVEMVLRDRMRNSADLPSVDSTVNYSQISGESETDTNSGLLESDDPNLSRGLGPRGTDPMLSSVSENRDASNDALLLPESPNLLSGGSQNSSIGSNGFNATQNLLEILDPWESESGSFSLNSQIPLNEIFGEQSQSNGESASQQNHDERNVELDAPGTSASSVNNSTYSAEYNMRQGIQRLSLLIENMQRLCWARIEILQRQKIRGMWKELTNQIKQFHNTIQTRATGNTSNTSTQVDPSNSANDLPSIRDLAISPSSTSLPSSSEPPTSSNYNSLLNGYKKLVESMLNKLFNETKTTTKSTQSESTSEQNSKGNNRPAGNAAYRNPARNETEEPQPGPSGISSSRTSRNFQVKNENLKLWLYKLFIEMLQKDKKKREVRSTVISNPNVAQRQNQNSRLRNASRARFRSSRQNRHLLNYFANRSRTLNRELEAILKSRKKNTGRGNASGETSTTPQPSTSASKGSTSSDACQSCGQKKKPNREFNRAKRSLESFSRVGSSSGSASKVLKNSAGERSRASNESERGEDAEEESRPSTSAEDADSSQLGDNSANELLRQMIQTMKTMLRFLPEAFCRTDDANGNTRQEPMALPSSSDDSDSEANDLSEQSEQFLRNLPHNFQCTKEIIANLMQECTQVRAKKLLGFMVKSLSQFFGKNFGSLIQVLDEQIFSLYMLLHLALELRDLLDQLNARSRELERTEDDDAEDIRSVETSTRNLLLSQPGSDAGRLRDRSRNLNRSSYLPFSGNREDSFRSKISTNPFLPSNSRPVSSRLNPSSVGGNDGSGNSQSSFMRKRRRMAAMSTSCMPRRWNTRDRRTSISSAVLNREVNGTSNGGRRSFRFGRRANEEESVSGIRDFNYEINNNRNNSNISVSNDRNNNQSTQERQNEGNNNVTSNDSGNRNFSSVSNNNSNSNSNFFNHYFSSSSNNSESSNNIIIVTGLNSSNDLINNSSNTENNRTSSSINSNVNNNEGSMSRTSGIGSSFLSQNPLPPLRSLELTLSRNESGDLSLRDERPIFWIRYGGNNETSNSSNSNESPSRVSTFTVPVVQVNDVPVSGNDVSLLNQPRHRPQSPVPRVPEDVWRWRAWRPRFLHPRYSGPNPFEDQDSNDVPENIHYYRILSTSAGSHLGVYTLDPMIITDAPLSPHHRIQAWDFSKMNIPDISDREANGVVPECKIHNDASVDVSNDGHLLVTLLPSGRLSVTTMLGVYSLDWGSLGQLLYRTSFEQNAVSVSLSPTNRHLLVGFASRPVVVRDRTNLAQIFRLEGGRPSPRGGSWQSGRGRLVHMRDLEQTRETNTMSLNCIRWAPGAGQGLVYGTNTGQLKVLR